MDRIINKIKLFPNNNIKSIEFSKRLAKLFIENGFEINNEDYDLAIAVGGDGSFLRMIKANNFNSDIYYVGVNTGTLGFAQEIREDGLEEFIETLNNNGFKVENIGIQKTKIYHGEDVSHFYSLNEIVIRDSELNTTNLNVYVNDKVLENFVGDGLLISTSFGSTAYNLNFGGSIIFNELHTLQITPIAPINSKSYRSLINSIVIPEDKMIKIVPNKEKDSLIVTVDGENNFYDNVSLIETSVEDKRIKCLRKKDYDFFEKVNEKFLK